MGFVWGRNMSDSVMGTSYFTKDAFLESEKEVASVGYGYAFMLNSYYSTRTYLGLSKVQDFINTDEARFWGEYQGETLFAPFVDPTDTSRVGTDLNRFLYHLMTVYSGEDAMEAFDYTLLGRLPAAVNEVAIPQWLYNCFLCYGYKSTDGMVYEINSEEDIIGKELALRCLAFIPLGNGTGYYEEQSFPAKIVGVIHTDYAAENFPQRLFITQSQDGDEQTELSLETFRFIDDDFYVIPPHMGIAVSRDFVETYNMDEEMYVSHIVVPRFQEYSEQYFELEYAEYYGMNPSEITHIRFERGKTLKIANSLAMSDLDYQMTVIYSDTSIYFEIVPYLGVFAAVLLMYLCFSTVMGKRRGVGIMQSMGATKGQVIFTVGIPILLFCVVCSLGTLCVELGFLSYMNGKLWETVLNLRTWYGYSAFSVPYPFTLGWETWLFTFGVPIAIAAITTLVTVWLVFRAPVLDNLNKKDFRLFSKRTKGVASRSIFSPPSSKD